MKKNLDITLEELKEIVALSDISIFAFMDSTIDLNYFNKVMDAKKKFVRLAEEHTEEIRLMLELLKK